MKIIDISWPITESITEYKDRTTIKLSRIKNYVRDGVNETLITIHGHTGTHIDAPMHFIENGDSIEKVNLNIFIGKCKVLNLSHVEEKITEKDIKKFDIEDNDIILLKTKNSNLGPTEKFNYNFVYLEKSGAQFLASKKIKLVGIDYLGIERNQPNHETHKILLENNIPIIEGLRLRYANKKEYYFYCLPISIPNIDSAPARAILIEK